MIVAQRCNAKDRLIGEKKRTNYVNCRGIQRYILSDVTSPDFCTRSRFCGDIPQSFPRIGDSIRAAKAKRLFFLRRATRPSSLLAHLLLLFSDDESSPVSVICGRGSVLFWIRALRPDSVRADTSAESQTRARSPGADTGSCTATAQRKLGGRRPGRIASESLEAGPERLSGKTVNSSARSCRPIRWRRRARASAILSRRWRILARFCFRWRTLRRHARGWTG